MQIRSEDIDAIVTAVELLIDGVLSTVHICNDGELIFSAHYDGSELVIDPDVMAPELARHLLDETSLGDSPQPTPSDPKTEPERTDRPRTRTESPQNQDRPVPA